MECLFGAHLVRTLRRAYLSRSRACHPECVTLVSPHWLLCDLSEKGSRLVNKLYSQVSFHQSGNRSHAIVAKCSASVLSATGIYYKGKVVLFRLLQESIEKHLRRLN